MRTIAFSSPKGGSGKTVTCAAFATVLSKLGFNVLVIDADRDTNGMTMFFLDTVLEFRSRAAEEGVRAAGLFDQDPDLLRACETTYGFKLLPAQYHLSESYDELADLADERLRSLTNYASNDFDFVLIDAQAGTDDAALAAASVASTVVITSEYDPVSIQGVKRLEQLAPTVFAPDRTWVLYNKVLPELANAVGDFLRIARYLPPIPWDADVVRAFVRRDLPVDMDAPNPYTLVIIECLEVLLGRDVGQAIEAWRVSAEEALRKPLMNQIEELDKRLTSLEEERIYARSRVAARQRFLQLGTTLPLAFMTAIVVAIVSLRDVTPIFLATGMAALFGSMLFSAFITQREGRFRRRYELSISRLDREIEDLTDLRRKLFLSRRDLTERLRGDAP